MFCFLARGAWPAKLRRWILRELIILVDMCLNVYTTFIQFLNTWNLIRYITWYLSCRPQRLLVILNLQGGVDEIYAFVHDALLISFSAIDHILNTNTNQTIVFKRHDETAKRGVHTGHLLRLNISGYQARKCLWGVRYRL